MLVRGSAEPKPGSVTSAAPPTRADVATMTMTYVRNDALCSAGAIARLTASSAESAPSYRSSVPCRGFHVRVRTASCTTYANATAASVSTLSSSAGVSPCHTRERDIDRRRRRLRSPQLESGPFEE